MRDLKDKEERFFSEVKDKKKRGNSCKLQQGKFFQEEILYGKSPDYTATQRNTGVPSTRGLQTQLYKTLNYLNPDLRLDNLQITYPPKLLYRSDTLKKTGVFSHIKWRALFL